MLEKQSLDEFLSNINKGKAVIISLSPQSRASLAEHFGISPLQVKRGSIIIFYRSFVCFSWLRIISSYDFLLLGSFLSQGDV